jgi:hypothetical protein
MTDRDEISREAIDAFRQRPRHIRVTRPDDDGGLLIWIGVFVVLLVLNFLVRA